MVRPVLSSLHVYPLTVVKAPNKFLKEIYKLRKRFLYGQEMENSLVANVRWLGQGSACPNPMVA